MLGVVVVVKSIVVVTDDVGVVLGLIDVVKAAWMLSLGTMALSRIGLLVGV